MEEERISIIKQINSVFNVFSDLLNFEDAVIYKNVISDMPAEEVEAIRVFIEKYEREHEL